MQAIILAAGMGKRLKELTKNATKCMVEVNGVTLIQRALTALDQLSLDRIVLVVGYEGKKLQDYVSTLDVRTPIVYVDNPIYDKTNNIYSLYLARNYLEKDDTLLLESDLIFEDAVLRRLVEDPYPSLALVAAYESWMDGTVVTLDEEDNITSFIGKKDFDFTKTKSYYKTVNIYKFSKEFSSTHYVPFLDAYQTALGENEYYEQVLRVITMLDDPGIQAKRMTGQRWYEIDDIQDLDIAESIFSPDEDERVRLLQSRYGGYWRYPKLLDFCYLVNPYFPPAKMKDELRANFDTLLTEYPSGMAVNALLAGKNFGVHAQNIVVGNGAAELIKSLMGMCSGRVGFIRPTFEEYPNRYNVEESVYFVSDNRDYSYTADDVMAFFKDSGINTLVLVNPDNPSGNYIFKAQLLRLVAWTKEQKIRLVVDESFVDFADEPDNSLIVQDILNANPHLFVMKSISKSYGIPGLRLGVLASGDLETIERMKKDVAIWNINSFGEFYMQISEKYKKDYASALVKFREERARFQTELAKLQHIRVIPSQANYVMVELDDDISPKTFLKRLLIRHNLLIKELTTKTNGRNYLRLAVRNREDNDTLLEAMREELDFQKGRKDFCEDH